MFDRILGSVSFAAAIVGLVLIGSTGYLVGHKIGYEEGSLERPVEVHVIERPVFVPVPGPTVEPGPTIVTVKIPVSPPVERCTPAKHRKLAPHGDDNPWHGAAWLNGQEYLRLTDHD
jgi:hypothetical protein